MHCLPQRVKKRMSKQENQQSPLKQLTNNPHQSHQSSPQESGTFLRKRIPRLQAVPAESHCHMGVHGLRTNSIMTLRWVYLISWARQACSHLLIMAHVPVPHFICFVQQPRPQHSAGARINTLKFHPNFRNYRTTQTNQHIICHKCTDNTRLTSVSSKSLQGVTKAHSRNLMLMCLAIPTGWHSRNAARLGMASSLPMLQLHLMHQQCHDLE